jgi:hypothetical protein
MNVLSDSRLGNEKLRCGFGKTQAARDGLENLQSEVENHE